MWYISTRECGWLEHFIVYLFYLDLRLNHWGLSRDFYVDFVWTPFHLVECVDCRASIGSVENQY